jgi:phenylacetate-CoA ligase
MKTKLDKAGVKPSDIRTVKDLEKIPITSKDDLIDLRRVSPPWGGLIAIPPEKLRKVYMSPGPIYDIQSLDENFYRRVEEHLYGGGFRPGDIVVNTWSYHMVPAGHWYDEAVRRLGATVIPMGVGNTELQVQVLHDMMVTGWIGSTGFLTTILAKAEEMGYDVRRDFALRLAGAGGEMGGGPMRKMFEEKYGLTTCDGYGTADVGFVAYECNQRSGMHLCEELVVEIVDPNTGKQVGPGEVGQVVVTPFDNTYPLIRFGTGDLSAYIDEPCPCGRTSLRLVRIMGRVGDAVRTRGMFIHPRQISEVVSKFPEISRYQAVVTRPGTRDHLVLKVEVADETTDKDKLMGAIGKTFQDVCRIRLDEVEFVPKGTIPEGAKGIVDERVY